MRQHPLQQLGDRRSCSRLVQLHAEAVRVRRRLLAELMRLPTGADEARLAKLTASGARLAAQLEQVLRALPPAPCRPSKPPLEIVAPTGVSPDVVAVALAASAALSRLLLTAAVVWQQDLPTWVLRIRKALAHPPPPAPQQPELLRIPKNLPNAPSS